MANDPLIVFAAGGTGGHLFPALAVAGELRRRHPGAAIVFVGGTRGLETRLVPQAGFPLRTLPVSGLKGTKLGARLLAGAAAASRGLALLRLVPRAPSRSRRRRGRLRLGSGRARRLVAPRAHDADGAEPLPGCDEPLACAAGRRRVRARRRPRRQRLGGIGLVTGNPVRPEFAAIGPPPNASRMSLLVFGGSRGARSINRAMMAALPRPRRDDARRRASFTRPVRTSTRRSLAPTRRTPASMPTCARSSTTCRVGLRRPTSSSAAPAPRPCPSSRRPGAPRSSCRSRSPRTTTSAPTPRWCATPGPPSSIEDRDLDGARCAAEIARLGARPAAPSAHGRSQRARSRAPTPRRAIADVADALLDGQGGAACSVRRGRSTSSASAARG